MSERGGEPAREDSAPRADEGADLADDPRLTAAVKDYLAAIEAGIPPDREAFIARHPAIAGPLARCLDGLLLLQAADFGPMTRPEENALAALSDGGADLVRLPLGDFQVERELARGGMGIVYEARQISLRRRVALKVLPFAAALDAKYLRRFRNEAQAAAQLQHPNIVPVYAVGCERGLHYYAMQLIEGESLAAVLGRRRRERRDPRSAAARRRGAPDGVDGRPPGPPRTSVAGNRRRPAGARAEYDAAADWIAQAAGALDHAHQSGIVHRDVKPANLLIDAKGCVWVTDFGLAHVQADAGLTQSGDLLGTLRYMSPEQAAGQRLLQDHRTDVYALGATLYELATLEPIFPGASRPELLRQILEDTPRAPGSIDAAIPVDLETIILKAIAKAPGDRYRSAQDLAEDLRSYVERRPIRARRPTIPQRAVRWLRRHPGPVAAAALVLCASTAGLLVANHRIAEEQAETAKRAAEADQRFQQARQAVDLLVQVCEEELSPNFFFLATRRRMLETALAYYQKLVDDREGSNEQQAELAADQRRVRRILDEISALHGVRYFVLVADPGVQDDLGLDPSQRAEVEGLDPGTVDARVLGDFLKASQMARLQEIAFQCQGASAFYESAVDTKLELSADQKERIRKIDRESAPGPGMFPAAQLSGGGMRPDFAAAFDQFRTGRMPQGDPWAAFGADPAAMARMFESFQARGAGGGSDALHDELRKAWSGEAFPLDGMVNQFQQHLFELNRAALEQALAVLTPAQRERWDALVGEPFAGPRGLPPSLWPSVMRALQTGR